MSENQNEGITDPSDGNIPNDANAENQQDTDVEREVSTETHVEETVTETPAESSEGPDSQE